MPLKHEEILKNNDPNLVVRFAKNAMDIKSAQRLRYRVFVQELGANPKNIDHNSLLELDEYDDRVDHLCLIDLEREKNDPASAVVGVYRLIGEETAKDIGGFYSQNEFDISKLLAVSGRKLELGRSCIDIDYRGGAAMAMLWSALGAYVEQHKIEYLFGAASFQGVDLTDKKVALSNLYHRYLAPENLRARANAKSGQEMNLMPVEAIHTLEAMRNTPSLIKAYLRLGGVIGEGAYIDYDFNTVDVFVLMKTCEMVQKYRAMYSR